MPWIMNSRYLWKTKITSYVVFPRCSISQICLCIEIGIGSVETDFTVDFTFQCALILTDFNLTQSFEKQTYRTKDSLELCGWFTLKNRKICCTPFGMYLAVTWELRPTLNILYFYLYILYFVMKKAHLTHTMYCV